MIFILFQYRLNIVPAAAVKQMVLALTKITERKGLVDVIFFNNLYLKLPMIILIIIGISYP